MTTFLIAVAAVSAGCSSSGIRNPFPRRDDVVVVNDRAKASRPRELHVPPGHYPPPGQCRVWYPGTPPGHQPKPTRCSNLIGKVPAGAFVLYNERAYDSKHDWAREKKNRPNSVPDVIVELTKSNKSSR
jgi:hypothetical protein